MLPLSGLLRGCSKCWTAEERLLYLIIIEPPYLTCHFHYRSPFSSSMPTRPSLTPLHASPSSSPSPRYDPLALPLHSHLTALSAVSSPHPVWGYHTSPKVEEMIMTCMAAQYSAPGDALGVSSSKTEKLTTKSVAIVAGKTPLSAAQHSSCYALSCLCLTSSSSSSSFTH